MISTLIPIGTLSASAKQTFTQYEEEEINDYIEDANFIEEYYEVIGSITENDSDFFCFELSEKIGISIYLDTYGDAHEIRLFDSNDRTYCYTYTGGNFNGYIEGTLDAGVYYFCIEDFGIREDGDYSNQKYRFTFKFKEFCEHTYVTLQELKLLGL